MLQQDARPFVKAIGLPWVTASIWAAVAASITFWALSWPVERSFASVTQAQTSQPATRDLAAPAARALGHQAGRPSTPVAVNNGQFKLMGVIASPSGQGSALIAIDGQPPKAYRVGQAVQNDMKLVSLTARQARLQSPSTETLLELPSTEKP